MTDTSAENTAKVIASPEPTSPTAAASYAVGRNVFLFISGTVALWTAFHSGGTLAEHLSAAYTYVNSVQGMPLLSSAAFLGAFAWGPVKKWLDKRLIKQQATVIDTISNAPAHEAVETIVALRNAAPAAPPITEKTS